MIDTTHQVNSVRRQVGHRVLEAGEARTVTAGQTYDATVEDVWDACTNPERLPRWFLPVSGELRLGGRYQIEGNAGGTIERCDPPKGFFATWEYDGEVSWVELRLVPEPGGGTRFELDHISRVGDERWAEYGPGAVGVGWDLMLLGLATHLSGAPPVDPRESDAWLAGADGRRFVQASSDGWRDADIAAGADEAGARAAAARTGAAYTAPPPGGGS